MVNSNNVILHTGKRIANSVISVFMMKGKRIKSVQRRIKTQNSEQC